MGIKEKLNDPYTKNNKSIQKINKELIIAKSVCSTLEPISIFIKDFTTEDVLSQINYIFNKNIIIIDFSKISDYKDILNKIESSDSSLVIFINIENISNIYECEQIKQMLLFAIECDEFIQNNFSIDFSKIEKIFIYNNSQNIDKLLGLNLIYRKTLIINL